MTIAIWGAGSVGLTLGARLARAGENVLFVCRSAEAAAQIDRAGVRFEDLGSGERWRARAAARAVADVDATALAGAPILLCVRSPQTACALLELSRVAERDSIVACVQNGIGGDALVAQRFATAIGVVYRQTCTRAAANAVASAGAGRLIVGLHPRGDRPAVHDLAERLRGAGYDVGISQSIDADRWLKLCVNLMSAPNALIRRDQHRRPEFVEIKARLLEEARLALRAAGITARSCDGRDRSLDEEIEFQRGALARGESARPLSLYNQVWSSLRHGGPCEADEYHERILELAERHDIEARMNARVLAALRRAVRDALGPECIDADELL
ncbi:MAG TPA: 2-dehydropantoate 2-reductase N-terminal domain-containing protein [Myxococcota bacterium]|nr:2-dehydropantoate 2-reductase N-terminal domain-containing protein [Myxococcota bacterium]